MGAVEPRPTSNETTNVSRWEGLNGNRNLQHLGRRVSPLQQASELTSTRDTDKLWWICRDGVNGITRIQLSSVPSISQQGLPLGDHLKKQRAWELCLCSPYRSASQDTEWGGERRRLGPKGKTEDIWHTLYFYTTPKRITYLYNGGFAKVLYTLKGHKRVEGIWNRIEGA